MSESNRKRLRVLPLAAALAAVLGGAAVLDVGAPPFEIALAQERPAASGFQAPSFADVVERASPAVVNISVTKVMGPTPTTGFRDAWPRDLPRSPLDEFFGRFFEMPGAPRRAAGAGSGFIVDPEGYIVTNHHVVSDAEEIVVTLADGRQLDARVVGDDPQMDLALLEVDADEPLPFVRFGDSDAVRVGDWVLAIGNPFGLGGSASAGIVSARGRDIRSGPYDDYLQIDAPINQGNSGGPVFNAAGEVIGVSTAIVSPNGGSVGIGFAIPSNHVTAVVEQLKETGSVERGWLGVSLQDLDEALAESLGIDGTEGALVAEVIAGSPADDAGFEVGDVVTRFDGEDIDSVRDLTFTVARHRPGESVTVDVIRDGRSRELEVELGDRARATSMPFSGSRAPARPGARAGETALGLRLAPLTDRERSSLGLPSDVDGALIVDVRPGSAAAREGLRGGDVIVSVNRQPVDSVDDVTAALDAARRGNGRALLLVRRGDAQHFVALDFS
ncbi:MAG TPA: DegQ family serine endoprotease [Gammaproteobacteria bacterium]